MVSYTSIRIISGTEEPQHIRFLIDDKLNDANIDEIIADAIDAFDLQVDLWEGKMVSLNALLQDTKEELAICKEASNA
jgi:hypothetical protein